MNNNLEYFQKCWLGLAEVSSGMLGFIGIEDMEGGIFNLANPTRNSAFGITSIKGGIGLGATMGIEAIIVLNCGTLEQMQGLDLNDWGLHLDFGVRLGPLAKLCKNRKFVGALLEVGANIEKITPHHLDTFKDAIYIFRDLPEALKGRPAMFQISVPIGLGDEVSLTYNWRSGKIRFYGK